MSCSRSTVVPTGVRVSRTGLTLLEVMVALVILGLVATGFLQTYAGALRGTGQISDWAQAVVYAEGWQEAMRLEGVTKATRSDQSLGGGFTRKVVIRPWAEGISRATVTVTLPDGPRFELHRLVANP